MAKAGDKHLIDTARARFRRAAEAEKDWREKALEDHEFYIGDGNQWPEHIRAQRGRDGEPCLEINDLPKFVAQVANELERTPPQITAVATEDSDTDVAEIASGLLRRIQFEAGSQEAYTEAAKSAVIKGFGYFRVTTDYLEDEGTEQKICIDEIRDPFTVYFDPACRKKDYSDARFAFVTEEIDADEFEARFPGKTPSSAEDFAGTGDQGHWMPAEGKYRIAEYWHVEETTKTRVYGGPEPRDYDDMPEEYQKQADAGEIELDGKKYRTKKRPVVKRKVKWCLIDGKQVLDEREWPGKWIPIFPVLGEEHIVKGKRYLWGMIRHAKDPQRMLNYWTSAATRTVALAPRAPFIGVEGQFEGYERHWEEVGSRNLAFLQYKMVTVDGKPAPPPQRQPYEPPIQAMSQMLMLAADQKRQTIGIYKAGLGDVGPERSGKAIMALQQEGDTANSNFGQALKRALHHAGRCIADLIPHIYDTPRLERILLPDMTSKPIRLNEPSMDPKTGVERVLDPSTWKFDVQVSIGPTYETQRQAAADGIGNLIKAHPDIMPIAGDLLVGALDIPNAPEIAKRLKAMLPPNLQEEGQQAQIPPEVQQQMQVMMQQHEQLTALVEQLTRERDAKQAELESKERIATLDAQVKLVIAQAEIETKAAVAQVQAESAESIAVLQGELDLIKQRMAALGQPKESVDAAPTA